MHNKIRNGAPVSHTHSQSEKEEPGRAYHLLLILTDGTIDDMADTKHELVEVSRNLTRCVWGRHCSVIFENV